MAQYNPDPINLGFVNVEQENKYWCWAALVQQVLKPRSYGMPPSQCQIVNMANEEQGINGLNCCANPEDKRCSRLGSFVEMREIINRYGGEMKRVDLPETPEDVYALISEGWALIAQVKIEDYMHIYLIDGIGWRGEEAVLNINDPAKPGRQHIPFAQSRPAWVATVAVK